MPTTSFMGRQVRRREDPRLITGSATYVDDIVLPSMAHMAILRSPHPHARILSIDTSAALDLPGVLAAVTGSDVPHLVPPQEATEASEQPASPPRPPLATERARYMGEPVAPV